MTREEFATAKFFAGMHAIYKREPREIVGVDFTNSGIYLNRVGWVHRRYVTLIEADKGELA